MQKYRDVVLAQNGTPASGAYVTVTLNSGGTPSIYSDNGVTLASNPLITDSTGAFSFYAADGRYNLSISGAGITTLSISDILLEDPLTGNTHIITGGSVDATPIGATTPSTGAFTTATATSLQAIIGNVTPAAGTFTALAATGNATLGDAEASDTHAIKGATTLLANSASAALTVTQTGAGNAFVVGASKLIVDSAGNVGIGAAASAGETVRIAKAMTGATATYGIVQYPTINSDSTGSAQMFVSNPYTQSAAFTCATVVGFSAVGVTLQGASLATTQIGYQAGSSLTGATTNFGFYSNIASAANRYNFYAAGSAPNYFSGDSLFATPIYGRSAIATPAGGSAGIYFGTSYMGVFFGSGAPTVSAAKGSLYLRSDGSTTNDRMYVNTNGSTTWTAVTTAA